MTSVRLRQSCRVQGVAVAFDALCHQQERSSLGIGVSKLLGAKSDLMGVEDVIVRSGMPWVKSCTSGSFGV